MLIVVSGYFADFVQTSKIKEVKLLLGGKYWICFVTSCPSQCLYNKSQNIKKVIHNKKKKPHEKNII